MQFGRTRRCRWWPRISSGLRWLVQQAAAVAQIWGSKMSEEQTLVLGEEGDSNTAAALQVVLKELGASFEDRTWGVGGSQEVFSLVAHVAGSKLMVESETYEGLSITGPSDLVKEVAIRVQAITKT